MPDEDAAQDEQQPTSPASPAASALDPEALAKAVSEQTARQVAEALAHQPTAQPPAGQPVSDPLGEVIAPYVQAGTSRAALIAQLAADKADFYAVSDPDELADRLAHKDEVEKRSLALAQAGRALPREDIYKHLKGEKFEEFAESRAKRRAAREKRAQAEGTDFTGSGAARDRNAGIPAFVGADEAYSLQSQGKLEEALEGKSF